MTAHTPAQANRRYHLGLWPAMAAYVALCFAAPVAIEAWSLTGPALHLAAFSPALPLGVVIILIGRWLRETDEFIRARQVEAMLVGLGATTFFTTGWGFLEIYACAPDFPLYLVLPTFFGVYGVAYCTRPLWGRG
ncbi:MAG: hypothetical protein MI723_16235 [Caulobacterales bacterium]|nr:hypothetical protein [Caulobacterales bacterium]